MRKTASGLLVLIALASARVQAGGSFGSGPDPQATLNWVRVTLNPNGSVKYEMAGSASVGGQTLNFSAQGAYDPATRKTSERLTEEGGNEIRSTASCLTDPWQVDIVCSSPLVSSKGYNSAAMAYITNLKVPISAKTLTFADREKLKAELQRATDEKKAVEASASHRLRQAGVGKFVLPTPTPNHLIVASAGAKKAVAASFSASPTRPTTPAYPPYGAVYTGGNPPGTMKAGQVASVAVTVQNTSSQTWPAGGLFRLAFHWSRAGVQIVHDGDRTFLPTAVAPGASVNLMAKVTAPPTAGAAVLQWDMVQEGVAWFSDKGVPMSAPKNVNVTP